ncbi:MAG: hypothetical protein DRR11_06220 [Gammaproteobacteria bacterium]|nr:MAG: hypothetical protein DRR15_11890 [Gammaproteobacteria bacterium]RLA33163.1 MAG: hypothetical protein DRR11_06220 [Gammaproteobacteria bacterium]
MNASTGHKYKGRSRQSGANRISKQILPALLAVGSACCFVAGSASALELGDIKVESKLGQPLRASIAYALNPNEQLFNYCIFLRPGVMASGIPSVSKARISVSGGLIVLTGNTPIREPALGMRVTVNCPYTAQLSREYTLMIDPGLPVGGEQMVATADPAPQTTSVAAVAAPQAVAQVQAAKPTPTQTRAPTTVTVSPARAAVVKQVDQSPITTNSQYFVQPGDSLYGIATRIENRQVALRPAANAIFSANPGAFTENDVNQLTAGVWIAIPDFLGTGIVAETITQTNAAPVASGYADEYTADDAATEEPTESTYTSFIADDVPEVIAEPVVETPVVEIAPVVETVEETAAVEEAVVPATPIVEATEEPVVAAAPVVETEAAEPAYLEENTADLRPGDIVIGGDTSVDSIDNVETTATDAAVEPAQAVSAAPVVSLPDGDAAGSGGLGSWLMWIGGAGLGVLLGLALFFGRRIKERFGGAPVNDSMEQLDDDMTDEVEVLSDFDNIIADEPSVVSDVDFQLDDSMISSQSISLDADLDAGTGLQNVTDVDVAQDFGFSASTTGEVESAVESVIDLELPEEAPEEPEKLPTDIIPPNHRIEDSILESEEPPSIDASAEYDLSMIVDATKQALGGDDLTAKDLMAVQVGTTAESEAVSHDMTLNDAVDIQALEQDYQEEYTQTLAMNEEIEQAAIDLALRLDKDDTGEVTSELPSVAEATETEAVSENDMQTEIASLDIDLDDMPTEIASLDDDLDDLEDTSVNPQLTAKMEQLVNEKTVEMPNPGSEKTVMMPNPGSEPTVEMPNPGNEPTVEMQVESGKIDTKKSQAS